MHIEADEDEGEEPQTNDSSEQPSVSGTGAGVNFEASAETVEQARIQSHAADLAEIQLLEAQLAELQLAEAKALEMQRARQARIASEEHAHQAGPLTHIRTHWRG